MDDVLRISCDDCAARGSDACGDCIVTFLCSREPDDAVVVTGAEVRSLAVLHGAGLVPGLRHVPLRR
jgi:hypothetical protein